MIFYNIFMIINFISLFGINLAELEDLHSSIPSLQQVFKTEELYIENVEIFLKYSNRNLVALKSKLDEFKGSINDSRGNDLSFSNKLYYQYRINDVSKSGYTGFSKNISSYRSTYKFSSNSDLDGVTRAISRLKNTYLYTAKEIATGSFIKVQNITTNKPKLTSDECFFIGLKLLDINELKNEAEEWFDVAYQIYNKDNKNNLLKKTIDISEILDFMAHVRYQKGEIKYIEEAITLVKKAIKIRPNYDHLYKQLKGYKQVLNKIKKMGPEYRLFNLQLNSYGEGCRGEYQRSTEVIKKLYCAYKYGQHPFLKLAPIKVEIQNIEPYVAIFHDALYDNEIELLKILSINLMSRALVWDPATASSVFSHLRTSQIGWLVNKTHPHLNIINQRLSDMTDMTMETSEMLQVMNYGIGGHYVIHEDFLLESTENNGVKPFHNFLDGNRIATVLFYLSDVEQGGDTIFPLNRLVVHPKKGTAAFWFNMLPRGENDIYMHHAACPVIFGSKWVANKWIRYNGQIFKRQCKINKNEHYELNF